MKRRMRVTKGRRIAGLKASAEDSGREGRWSPEMGKMYKPLKKRVTLRFDFRNHLIFDPNHTQSAQEFSGGLAIVF